MRIKIIKYIRHFEWTSVLPINIIFIIYLTAPGLSCGMQDLVSWQGSKPGPPSMLRQQFGVLTTGPPGKVLLIIINIIDSQAHIWITWAGDMFYNSESSDFREEIWMYIYKLYKRNKVQI